MYQVYQWTSIKQQGCQPLQRTLRAAPRATAPTCQNLGPGRYLRARQRGYQGLDHDMRDPAAREGRTTANRRPI